MRRTTRKQEIWHQAMWKLKDNDDYHIRLVQRTVNGENQDYIIWKHNPKGKVELFDLKSFLSQINWSPFV
jgi:hypothetical protein